MIFQSHFVLALRQHYRHGQHFTVDSLSISKWKISSWYAIPVLALWMSHNNTSLVEGVEEDHPTRCSNTTMNPHPRGKESYSFFEYYFGERRMTFKWCLVLENSHNMTNRHRQQTSPSSSRQMVLLQHTDCEQPQQQENPLLEDKKDAMMTQQDSLVSQKQVDDNEKEQEAAYFYGLFPKRQLFQPELPYPLWNYNWDGKLNPDSDVSTRELRKHGVTRHVILIRHGQYDETHRHDEARVLTPLGEKQAHLTGQRIAQLIHSIEQQQSQSSHDPNQEQEQGKVVAIRVSNLTRAKQTATIIAQYIPTSVLQSEPDDDLNEGRPCHTIPCTDRPILYHKNHTTTSLSSPKVPLPLVHTSTIRQVDEGHDRIERAFHRYFYRSTSTDTFPIIKENTMESNPASSTTTLSQDKSPMEDINHTHDNNIATQPPICRHEYEIIVCHANVIRYFVCRALQRERSERGKRAER